MVVLLVWFVFTNLILMFGATEDSLSEISPNQLTTAMELLDEKRFPIVYFFTMNENACHRGLPNYMTDSINQAIETQSECCEVQKDFANLSSSFCYDRPRTTLGND